MAWVAGRLGSLGCLGNCTRQLARRAKARAKYGRARQHVDGHVSEREPRRRHLAPRCRPPVDFGRCVPSYVDAPDPLRAVPARCARHRRRCSREHRCFSTTPCGNRMSGGNPWLVISPSWLVDGGAVRYGSIGLSACAPKRAARRRQRHAVSHGRAPVDTRVSASAPPLAWLARRAGGIRRARPSYLSREFRSPLQEPV